MTSTRSSDSRSAHMLAFRREGDFVFCIPGAGDNITSFMDIANDLGRTHRVYGLQPRGLDGAFAPHDSIVGAAAHYADAIREIACGATLHLIGHSFGGWVAAELAASLPPGAGIVRSLTILDSAAPDARKEDLTDGVIREAYVKILEQRASARMDMSREQIESLSTEHFLAGLHKRLVKAGQLHASSAPQVLSGPYRTFHANLRTGYDPVRSFGGRAVLALARDPDESELDSRRRHADQVSGWRRHMPELHQWQSAGDHMTMLRGEHAHIVCAMLRRHWLAMG